MLPENEFILILIFILLIGVIVKSIIDKTIEYIIGGIGFLILMWIISSILDYFGFTALADFLGSVVSFPTNFVDYLKDYFS